MYLERGERTIIVRLKLRSTGAGLAADRVRAERLFCQMRLNPVGLAPSAIVCIRALSDPLPGQLDINRAGLCPSQVWEEAARSAIDRLARGAVRPALGAVPLC